MVRGKTIRRGFLASCILLMMFGLNLNFNPSAGNGEKIGQITKVSTEGIFRKTVEAELIRGGFTDGSGTVGTTPFHFTITSDELRQKAAQYMRSQTEVVIRYRIELFSHVLRSGSRGVFLESIEPKK